MADRIDPIPGWDSWDCGSHFCVQAWDRSDACLAFTSVDDGRRIEWAGRIIGADVRANVADDLGGGVTVLNRPTDRAKLYRAVWLFKPKRVTESHRVR
jgi:hypothetical protein